MKIRVLLLVVASFAVWSSGASCGESIFIIQKALGSYPIAVVVTEKQKICHFVQGGATTFSLLQFIYKVLTTPV
jgi:hypothetical protein